MLTSIHLGAAVQGFQDEHLGKIAYLIANPQSGQLTHFVLTHTGTDREILVEVGRIEGIADDHRTVRLNLSGQQLAELPDFIERDYVDTNITSSVGNDMPVPLSMPSSYTNTGGNFGTLSPLAGSQNSASGQAMPYEPMLNSAITGNAVGPVGIPYEEKLNVPEDSLIVRQGARVEALNGKLGSIKDVNIDPNSGRLISFVVAKGFLFTEDVEVPVELVSEANQDMVYLNVTKEDLANRPTGQLPPTETSGYNQDAR